MLGCHFSLSRLTAATSYLCTSDQSALPWPQPSDRSVRRLMSQEPQACKNGSASSPRDWGPETGQEVNHRVAAEHQPQAAPFRIRGRKVEMVCSALMRNLEISKWNHPIKRHSRCAFWISWPCLNSSPSLALLLPLLTVFGPSRPREINRNVESGWLNLLLRRSMMTVRIPEPKTWNSLPAGGSNNAESDPGCTR